MNTKDICFELKSLGLSDKAARVYVASLALGETSILELSKKSHVPRTSIYYTIEELKNRGMITEVDRGKKSHIMYVEPEIVIRELREKLINLDGFLPELEEIKFSGQRKPAVEFYFGPAGFKEVWFKLLTSGCHEFRITTDANHFGGYVKEKYIAEEIINEKKRLNIKSRQIIINSQLARSIVAKDEKENRKSKFLPPEYNLSFTEIIAPRFVAFISPRQENLMFTVDHMGFAESRASMFDALWDNLKA